MIMLADRIAATPTAEAALSTATRTVAEALRSPYVALVVRAGDQESVISESGSPRPVALTVPLVENGDRIGDLLLAPRTPRDTFTPADQLLLRGFVDRLTGTVAVVRLTEELRRSREAVVRAREEERRRVRNELHDGVGPVLASVALTLGRVRRGLPADDPRARELAEAADEVRASITDIRSLAHDLRPGTLDDLGLLAAIEQRAARLSDPARTVVTVEAEPLGELPAAVEVAAYRIVGEALTNVDRHAQARTATVRLHRAQEALTVVVADDGVGTDAGAADGLGLGSMRSRAAELGGRFIVGGRSDGHDGTEVEAWLPIR